MNSVLCALKLQEEMTSALKVTIGKKEQQQFTRVAKERKEDQKPFKIPGILKPS